MPNYAFQDEIIPVNCYRKDNDELVGTYKSQSFAGANHGVKESAVSQSVRAKKPQGTFSRKLKIKVYFRRKTI